MSPGNVGMLVFKYISTTQRFIESHTTLIFCPKNLSIKPNRMAGAKAWLAGSEAYLANSEAWLACLAGSWDPPGALMDEQGGGWKIHSFYGTADMGNQKMYLTSFISIC